MDLSEADIVFSTISGILIFHKKDSNSGQYGGISHKDNNKPRIQIQDNYTSQKDDDDDAFKYSKDKYEDQPEE